MNRKNVILEIIRHPAIKRILEARMATTSEVARLVVEEVMSEQELGQKKYEGQVEQLTRLVTSKKYTNFSGAISKFLETKPKGLEAFVANMGKMDPQQLLEILGDKNEWFKDRKVQIEKEAKAGKLDYAAFLLMNEFKKWEAQYKEAYEAYNTATGASETGNPDQQSYNKFRAIVLVWQDMLKSAVSLIKASQEAEEQAPDPNERKKLTEDLLKAKDIKTFLAIYKKLAGEEYKEQFIGTVKVIKALIDLKKQLSDNPDELLEKGIALLDKNYIEKKLYMDLEQISEKIRDKMFELVTDIKLDQDKEKFMKQPFENLLLDLRKVGDMRKKLEVISKRFPEYMTPDYGLKTLDDLNEYKNLFMALVGGRTMEKGALDEEEEKPTLPGQKEARQFLIGIIAYYKLSEKESYEKIKADDEKFQKELQRIMKAADHMDSFNQPLADALRKFVEEMNKKPEEPAQEEPAAAEEQVQLEKDAIDNYIRAQEEFSTKFLKVNTLHAQSEIFRKFYSTIFPIAGINPDTIMGDQVSAYTQTARPDLNITQDETEEEPAPKRDDMMQEQEEQKAPDKKLTKNVSQGANVIERHANAILEIMEGYEKYLNIDSKEKGGVEQGSRALYNKFGESDPIKLIRKFVKLIVKDINNSVTGIDKLVAQIDQAFAGEEKKEVNEAVVDNSVRDLPTRDKIMLVIKTGNQITKLSKVLKDKISKVQTAGQKEEEKPQNENILREEPVTEPQGTEQAPRDLEQDTRAARQGDEIQLGYKKIAKQIYDLMNKIRPLFPTSQPFDSNYDFGVAMKSFKAALKGLSSHVAQVSGYEYDELTSKDVLESFKEKIIAFKRVIKDVFGFSEENKNAKKQAAFSEAGEDSGLPSPDQDTEETEEDKPAGTSEEIKAKISAVVEDYERTNAVVKMIMLLQPKKETDADSLAKPFVMLLNSQRGKITGSISGFSSKNAKIKTNIKAVEKTVGDSVEEFVTGGDYKQKYDDFEQNIITWLKQQVTKGTVPLINEEKEKIPPSNKPIARIRLVGTQMISMLAKYYLFAGLLAKEEFESIEIKEIDQLIKEYKTNASQMYTVLSKYPIPKDLDSGTPDWEPGPKSFYENFHKYKIPGFVSKSMVPKDDKGGDDSSSPVDQEQEKKGALEERISNKLKPLIREMLTKGK